MSDEFKIDILRSIKHIIKTIPKRNKIILSFLSNCLKTEGNYEFKKYAIEIVEMVVNEIAEAKENALNTLSEYIEDC
jgi:coatomer protein complex subunit gamma